MSQAEIYGSSKSYDELMVKEGLGGIVGETEVIVRRLSFCSPS